jgi:nucleotidyltransferase substrate binding protein (TIGR01987 family)
MTDSPDIRWQQRFENFSKAYHLLKEGALISHPTEIERAGMVQFFEMSFELAWKLLKDYLESEGYSIKSPRQAIKQGVQAEVIHNGQQWLEALQDPNLTVHTYHEQTAIEVETLIKTTYLPLLSALYIDFKNRMDISSSYLRNHIDRVGVSLYASHE